MLLIPFLLTALLWIYVYIQRSLTINFLVLVGAATVVTNFVWLVYVIILVHSL